MRGAHALIVLLLAAAPAWGEPPSAVIGALVEGDPANADVEAAAHDVAATLRIERASHVRIWREVARDDYEAPSATELGDAVYEVSRLCFGGSTRSQDDENALKQAASTLARVTGEQPNHRATVGNRWHTYRAAAERAAACMRRAPQRQRVTVTVVARDDRAWTLYANGRPEASGIGDRSVEIRLPYGDELYLHARCDDIRCSRTIHRKDFAQPIELQVDAVGARLHGRMSDTSLSVSYVSAADRNENVARDAAVAADVLAAAAAGARRGDAIVVMTEGPDLRLVYSDEDGGPIRTLRTSREALAGAARRLVDGETEPAVGAWQAGKHRVVVQPGAGAPSLSNVQSSFDPELVPTRAFCRAGGCAFAAPSGRLRMRFDEEMWNGPLEKTVDLDKDLLVTVQPGRRYWAKYSGLGLITAGAAGMTVAFLSNGIKSGIANAVCEAASEPGEPECDEGVPANKWETAAFWGGLATVAAGTLLYLVVHKKPRIRVSPLGAARISF